MKKNNLKISVIGAGRVGSALAFALSKKGFKFFSIIDLNLKKAEILKNAIKALNCSNSIKDLNPETNLIFITTPDDQILSVSNQLSKLKKLNFRKLTAIHTSGTYTIDVLSKLKSVGANVISLHPVQTFPATSKINELVKFVENIYFGVEADKASMQTVKCLLSALNSKMIILKKEHKPLYHIACIFASNYIIANLHLIEILSRKIGIGNTWKKAFEQLIYTTLNNSLKFSPVQALTGPIERGDVKTIVKHLDEMKQNIPELLKTYCILGIEVAKISYGKKSIKKSKFDKIVKLLKENI